MAHLAIAAPEKVHPSHLELVPTQGTDCSARLGTAAAQVRGISKVIGKERGALGRSCEGRSLCCEGDWLGAAVRGRSVTDGEVSELLCSTGVNLCTV